MSITQDLSTTAQVFNQVNLQFSFAAQSWQGHVLSVQDVNACDVPTGLPHVPVYIRGSINMSGWVAPVLDIHQYCGFSPQSLQSKRVAVVQFADQEQERLIMHITDSLTQTPPKHQITPHDDDIDPSMFIGIAIVDGQLLILMDAAQLITAKLLKQ